MVDDRKPVECDAEDAARRALQVTFAAGEASNLLITLADGWRDATGATEAYVSLLAEHEDVRRLIGCLSRTGLDCRALDFEAPNCAHWEPETVTSIFSGCDDRSTSPGFSVHAIPFQLDESTVGGVILVLDPGQTLNTETTVALASWSGRLLEQARTPVEETENNFANQLRASKLEAMAEFSAGAGHEINNPLATIIGRAQLLLKNETDPARRQSLTTIAAQAYRVRDMIGDAMLFGRPPEPTPEPVELGVAVTNVLECLQEKASQRNCSFEVDATASITIHADPVQLAVVISSLVNNAIEAQPVGGGVIQVTVSRISDRVQEMGMLRIRDEGIGLSEIEREHLFDPFFSGRQAGRGLGFGLSKAWRIVERHGGQIDVETDQTGATVLTLLWPTVANRPEADEIAGEVSVGE
jgi:signal transduction histidine kinase